MIVLTIYFLSHRKRWTNTPRRESPYTSSMSKMPPPSQVGHMTCALQGEQMDNYANYATHTRVCKLDANQYTHVWEMPIPQGVALAQAPVNQIAAGDCCRTLPTGLKYGSTELLEHCHDLGDSGNALTLRCNGAGDQAPGNHEPYDCEERQAINVQPLPPYFDND